MYRNYARYCEVAAAELIYITTLHQSTEQILVCNLIEVGRINAWICAHPVWNTAPKKGLFTNESLVCFGI